MGRKAKIAATLGPSCSEPKTLARMVAAGLDVARLNLSHGEPAGQRRLALRLRQAATAGHRVVALMADLQGPRLRVGRLEGGALELKAGRSVELHAGVEETGPGAIPVTYAALTTSVDRGGRVLIDDGKIELVVLARRRGTVRCEVVRGGIVHDRKGINLPGSRLDVPALTAKDRRDLATAVELGADWLAVSFVQSAKDVELARRLTERAGRRLPVMAKIERREALARLDEIVEAADGLLVARGDLGVEMAPEEVPPLQKQIIALANAAGKPVVTATQMLESMRESPRPTRAEASDVANAVLDGSDCLLLTAETAMGRYPVESVKMMHRIIECAEAIRRPLRTDNPGQSLSVPQSICLAGCRTAYEVGARSLAVFTQSGFSARQVARFRPETPILAFAADATVARALALQWGVEPRTLVAQTSIEQMVEALDRVLIAERRARRGEIVVVLAGSPLGVAGTTNWMHVHAVGSRVHARA